MSYPYRRVTKTFGEKPVVWPKPPYLRSFVLAKRLRFFLTTDLLRGRCRAVDSALIASQARINIVNTTYTNNICVISIYLLNIYNINIFRITKHFKKLVVY